MRVTKAQLEAELTVVSKALEEANKTVNVSRKMVILQADQLEKLESKKPYTKEQRKAKMTGLYNQAKKDLG